MSAPPRRSTGGRNCRLATVSSTTPIDAAIAVIASKQWGNITRLQLREVGLDDAAIRRRVKAGRLFRVHRGVYAVGRPPVTPHERAAAAVLACGERAALSHGSAMTLWGFWRRWDEPFEILVPRDCRQPGITVHRSSTHAWRDLRTHLGLRVTSPARTILDISPRLNDKQLTRTVSNGLHSPWLKESQLADTVVRHARQPGAARIAALLGHPGTPTRSGWEDDFPGFCRHYGLPAPVMGAPVCGYTVDALFPEHKVIVELDSVEYHLDPIAFETDRERDAETAAYGFLTIRITWQRLERAPRREASRLQRILAAHAPNAA